MVIWDSKTLREALSVSVADDIQTAHVEFNSKDIKGGELFIALTGGASDGHLYVKDAISRGASCAIVSKLVNDVDHNKLIVVDDTYKALLKLASYKRSNSQAKFIGVTGSVGKTSTKNAIYMSLNACGKAFVTRGNFNNHLGLPINLASMPNDISFAVIEMGMNHKGELAELTKLVHPDIAIITNVEAVHIEYFSSIEEIVDAKCEIFSSLDPKDGIAIINADSPYYTRIQNNLHAQNIHNIYSVSRSHQGNANLLNVHHQGNSMVASYNIMGEEVQVNTNITGAHQAFNIAIALLVVKLLKQDLKKAALGLSMLEAEKGRGLVLNYQLDNGKNITIINDAYNASVPSIIAGLENIKNIPGKRRVAVLADMYELGEYTQRLHESLSAYIEPNNIDLVITVGPFMRYLHDKLSSKIAKHCEDLSQLKQNILNYLEDEDVVLFKGSKGTKLHVFVEEFINNKINSNAL